MLGFFMDLGAPAVDFLIPDHNHDTFPADWAPGSVGAWLAELFDLWLAALASSRPSRRSGGSLE
jgi:hypothetical protein